MTVDRQVLHDSDDNDDDTTTALFPILKINT